MLFNSYLFVLIFLPVSIVAYHLLNHFNQKAADWFLIGMSCWFYGYGHPIYLLLLGVSIFVNWFLSKAFRPEPAARKVNQYILAAACIFNILFLGYFKYSGFIIWNLNALFRADLVYNNLILPLGISFITFQQISYIVDSYRGETEDCSFREYLFYVTFFPKISEGPIVFYHEMIPQMRDPAVRKINYDCIIHGLMLFTYGLAKKVLLADILGGGVDWSFQNIDVLTSSDVFITMLLYTFQIYFDFSGYCDMAGGIAEMFGYSLPINFDSPYKSLSITDFWKRWHITLTRFLTKYIYIPLGGNRRGKRRTYINILIVFLISGIWHGANYTFILWGLMHGIASIFDRVFLRQWNKVYRWLRWMINFLFISIAWLLFRSSGIREWILLMKKMLFSRQSGISADLLLNFKTGEIDTLARWFGISDYMARFPLFYLLIFLIGSLVLCLCFPNNQRRKIRTNIPAVIILSAVLVWCVFTLGKVSVFLYFNF
jgi:alginate O-acetyltransferase complex protein AlgI